MTNCQICGKVFKSGYGVRSHIWRKHTDEGQKFDPNVGYKTKHRRTWNKGLTKETDLRVKKNSENSGKALIGRSKGWIWTDEGRKIHSEKMSLHNPGGRSKWFDVDGQKVQGTYEKAFAERCRELNIKWKKCKVHSDIFSYFLDGKEKHYTPDFYLPDSRKFVEIKGFWWGRDKEKIQSALENNPILKDNFILLENIEDIQRFTLLS